MVNVIVLPLVLLWFLWSSGLLRLFIVILTVIVSLIGGCITDRPDRLPKCKCCRNCHCSENKDETEHCEPPKVSFKATSKSETNKLGTEPELNHDVGW